jgi:hypothetical protein
LASGDSSDLVPNLRREDPNDDDEEEDEEDEDEDQPDEPPVMREPKFDASVWALRRQVWCSTHMQAPLFSR